MPVPTDRMKPTQKVERHRLSHYVRVHLSKMIAGGELQPGDELPSEGELARNFNVSKPVVREALSELATLRVVEIRQGRSTVVREMDSRPFAQILELAVSASPTRLRDFLELRRALESEAAALAAERRTEEQAAELTRIAERMRRVHHDSQAWIGINWEFHLAVAQACHNPLLLNLFLAMEKRVRAGQRLLTAQRHLRDPDQTLARHLAVQEAIVAGDAAGARQAMLAHFSLAREVADILASADTTAAD